MRSGEFDRWMSRARVTGVVNQACRVQQARVRLLLAHARAEAVVRLREMAAQTKDTELARRACVNLLRVSAGIVGAGREKDRTKESEREEAMAKEAERERVLKEAAAKLVDEEEGLGDEGGEEFRIKEGI